MHLKTAGFFKYVWPFVPPGIKELIVPVFIDIYGPFSFNQILTDWKST